MKIDKNKIVKEMTKYICLDDKDSRLLEENILLQLNKFEEKEINYRKIDNEVYCVNNLEPIEIEIIKYLDECADKEDIFNIITSVLTVSINLIDLEEALNKRGYKISNELFKYTLLKLCNKLICIFKIGNEVYSYNLIRIFDSYIESSNGKLEVSIVKEIFNYIEL